MWKTYFAIAFFGLVGLTCAGFAIAEMAAFLEGVHRTPENPDWNSISGLGAYAGFSNLFLLIAAFLWRFQHFPAVLERTKISDDPSQQWRKRQIAKVKVIFLLVSLFCFFILRPVLYVTLGAMSFKTTAGPGNALVIKSNDAVPNWAEGVPYLAGHLFLYLAISYPFSFRWPSLSTRAKTGSSAPRLDSPPLPQ
jgi:hypothetical protein